MAAQDELSKFLSALPVTNMQFEIPTVKCKRAMWVQRVLVANNLVLLKKNNNQVEQLRRSDNELLTVEASHDANVRRPLAQSWSKWNRGEGWQYVVMGAFFVELF